MDTKLKGDIAEQAAVLAGLRRGWGALQPVGDRLPYDLVYDVDGILVKIQVKSAWFSESRGNYVVDNRRTKTNRRQMIRESYHSHDFDLRWLISRTLTFSTCFQMMCSSHMAAKSTWSNKPNDNGNRAQQLTEMHGI